MSETNMTISKNGTLSIDVIKESLTKARKLAVELDHSYVGCEHLFYSFLKMKDYVIL